MPARAAVLTVGDEILGGYTLDTNSHVLAQKLRARGVRVVAKETVPDEPEAIAESLRRLVRRKDVDLAFVVGGIGPTPDDRTYAGVARAVGRTLAVADADRAWMERRIRTTGYGKALWARPEEREALLRMIRLPKGAEAIPNPIGLALGAWIKVRTARVVVLPGVPREFEAMLEASVLPRLRTTGRKEVVRELKVSGQEADWYSLLARLDKEHPGVRIGSYPQGRRRIVFRASGPAAEVARVLGRLRRKRPG